ncbi:unnamed protein product [Prunus armeniaca]|uniref:Uncharacterized protein n=1 Tax=Prunus armeniaca TaxID=36596 RepID=A0A6J5V6N6_PRUAR|nr:unnamed protein product [Prunus armeniaca]
MIASLSKNYGLHSPKGGMEVRPNKGSLHEYQDRHERLRYQPKRGNQHVSLRYEEIDPLNPIQDRSMWIPIGRGKNRDVAYVSRPCLENGNGIGLGVQNFLQYLYAKLKQEELRGNIPLPTIQSWNGRTRAKADAMASLEAVAVEEIKLH